MEVWSRDGRPYQVVSGYCLPDDTWQYELTGVTETGPYVTVVIPDATPHDGPFTPKDAHHALVAVSDGVTPWPILMGLVNVVESSGDIVDRHQTGAAAAEEPLASNNVWLHDGRQFEVNSFYFGDRDAWCYELYEVSFDSRSSDHVDVQIPDAQPAGGPFVPATADHVTLTAHGEWAIPWPVFRRFIAAIQASGDIVENGR